MKSLVLTDSLLSIRIDGPHFRIHFDRETGELNQIELFNGRTWRDVLADKTAVGLNSDVPVKEIKTLKEESELIVLEVVQEDAEWRIVTQYEIYRRGYVTGTFQMEALRDGARAMPRTVAVRLDEETVFSRPHRIINENPSPDLRQYIRGISVNFSMDERPVTNSLDFLLESVVLDMTGKPPTRYVGTRGSGRELGWKLTSGWPYPYAKGYRYENRWGLSFTALDNAPNPVRGQRIYHWFGNLSRDLALPEENELLEMHEYGCSLIILHMPMLTGIDTRDFRNPQQAKVMVQRAHELGIKVMVYAQPYLVSRKPEFPEALRDKRTECLNVWSSLPESQIVCYDGSITCYDCDELNLRHPEAFRHIKENALSCLNRYGLDGLYIDFAWPAQGLAKDPEHPERPGIFNFYDYWRLMREWRQALGPDQLMIGHGGGFLVGSDMVEGFDACLTGEAQRSVDPASIGQQYGTTPTLWIVQRNKKDIFRSEITIENCIREGMTPQIGLGVVGKATIANDDPAYFPGMIALWQMWRAFPMERARVFLAHTEPALSIDNEEIVHSLYLTPEKQILLLIANIGGPRLDDSPATGCHITLDLLALGLPASLRCWRLKGTSYENFRIAEIDPVIDGRLQVYEIDHHECLGYIFSPGEPPETLTALQSHLKGRFQRLAPLQVAKQERLLATDRALDSYAKLPNAHVFFSYEEFMKGRVVE